MMRISALVAVLVFGFVVFFHFASTPAPAPATAPTTEFSATRALVDITAMAPVPHPVGTPANAAVRDYLVRRMIELGLSPRVQSDQAWRASSDQGEPWVNGARVENVIGVLRGRDSRLPALALMAHHDSVPGSPGAADDTTGVADALEIVRAIKASGTPRRDVMLVITDGEEVDLIGATAFFADDPAAKHVGFVFNLEARGGGGRAAMFETGPDNGAAVDIFRATAVRPSANSLSVFLYRQLPNDTDYTAAKAAGVSGLNFAFIGRQFDYHSPSSTVAALDRGSVQQMGEEVLGPARALAFAPTLPPRTQDAVYGNIVGDILLAYPPWVGWLLLAAIAGLVVQVAVRARKAGELKWLDVAQGVGAAALLLAGGALALHLVRHLTGVGFGWIEGRALLARFPPYEAAIALAALAAALLIGLGLALGEARFGAVLVIAAATLASSAFGGWDFAAMIEGVATAGLALILLGRPASLGGTWIGLLAAGLMLALLLQIVAPTTAHLIAWPLGAGALVAALLVDAKTVVWLRWTAALIIMVLVTAWAGSLTHQLLEAMDLPELPALAMWFASMVLWPLLWPRWSAGSAGLATAALACALGLSLWLHFTSPWSPRHPRVAEPFYVIEQGGGAWRASPFKPDPWTAGVLAADGGKVSRVDFPTFRAAAWAAPAVAVPVTAPAIDVTKATNGAIAVHATMSANTTLDLELRTDAAVTGATVNGKSAPILGQPGKWTHIHWEAASGGVTAAFMPVGHGTLDIRYAEYVPTWPTGAKPLPPMPPDLMAWDMSGSTVVTGRLRSGW